MVAFELARACRLLGAGRELASALRGWARLAVAGYVAGGQAPLDAIAAAPTTTCSPPRPGRAAARGSVRGPCPSSSPGGARVNVTDAPTARARRSPGAEAKNFSYGIRLLRPPERRALSAVYALARRIDDIGDGDGRGRREARRPQRRPGRRAATRRPTSDDPVLVALADAARRYHLPMEAFGELIDGCEMDVRGTTLRDHRRAGRLLPAGRRLGRPALLAVFGTDDPAAADPLADDLGVALQLTNILRDVVEDRGKGRVYLPAADAAAVGCPPDLAGRPRLWPSWSPSSARRRTRWFDRGLRLLPLLDRRSRACVARHGRDLPPPARAGSSVTRRR